MTDSHQQLLEELLPKIRSTVWQASLFCSLMVGSLIYAISRLDVIELRNEMRRHQNGQVQQQQVVVKQAEGLLERETRRILKGEDNGL